ncbi:endo-1,4-beta-xylanase [Opitutus terrae]|uniref:Beta-xylanase n=1 Tax=Opitutus terrae (strain DSM 11246 / JCM 15787 / PB90-1) TaxID=452637 RepID=B1ZN37_OPITP|nr:endo-1,4-beta-xylanase [Opitutus terrae]ACB76489.1 glycoside hydrolase family 10 [Opitutus terrae PB90-1]
MSSRLLLFVSLVATVLAPLSAQTSLPAGEPLLGSPGLAAFGLQTMPNAVDAVSVQKVPAAAAPGFTEAWRIQTLRDVNPSFAIQLRAPSSRALKRGDIGFIRFFARTVETADESGTARISVSVRHATRREMGSIDESFNPPREWTEYLLPFRSARDYPANEAVVALSFGFKRQVIELGGLEAVFYGTSVALKDLPRTRFTYAGREPDAAWRKAALARIEQIRKGDIAVRVVDAAGKPIPHATVRLEQTRSAFQFGTAIPFARLVNDTPDNKIYREKVLELFNAASPENDLKWGGWLGEFEYGTYSQAQALGGLRWLREHNIPARGHVLVWPGWNNLPKHIRALKGTPQQSEIPALVREHITEIGTATRDWLVEFDVLNEPYTNHDLMDLFGPEIMVDWFKTARAAMPKIALYFNDFSNHDATTDREHVQHFEDTTRFLLGHGAPVDGLGLQAHIGGRPNAPENVLAVLDRYWNAFKLPVRFTEFDIRTSDEELQADYTRDFFILAFSHPSVVGIQLWGFWEKSHWIPVAAMYRDDWSEKPNAAVYKSLVLDQWRTRSNGTTAADGTLKTRGFFGDYVVHVDVGGRQVEKTFTLAAGQPGKVELQLP